MKSEYRLSSEIIYGIYQPDIVKYGIKSGLRQVCFLSRIYFLLNKVISGKCRHELGTDISLHLS